MSEEAYPGQDYVKRHDFLNQSFKTGGVFEQTEEDFLIHLRTLGEMGFENTTMHPTQVIRALVINHLQMKRVIVDLQTTMKNLNAENGKATRWLFWLTIIAVVCGVIQAFGVFWVVAHTR